MRKFSTILLLISIFLQTFSSLVIQANYLLNKGYITKALCINKDKPKMHCNGKCYLAKKLREEEKQERQAPVPKMEKFEAQPFFLPNSVELPSFQFSARFEYYDTKDRLIKIFPLSVFRPPLA